MAGPDRGGRRSRRGAVVFALAIIVALMLAAGGIFMRDRHETALADETDAAALVSVAVIAPRKDARMQELSLPGDVEAYYLAPIYAQVSGYLRMWYKDIGAKVKAGELLADISTPSLDEELHQAEASVEEAKAAAHLAEVTANRWQNLVKSQAVSQQSTDSATSDAGVKKAAVAAAQANLARLRALESFKRLVAPFDGVVTVRRTDVGALIRADSSQGPELFAVADIHAMRVYVRVPQAYASRISIGMKAKLRLPEYPQRSFAATLTTTAHAVNLQSRTLLVELEAPNPDGILSPGSFATVEFELPPTPGSVLLPTSALIFQQNGMQAAVVGPDNKVSLHNIRIGRDFGTEVEIISGLPPSAAVIDQPPDDIFPGEEVRVTSHQRAPPAGEPPRKIPLRGS